MNPRQWTKRGNGTNEKNQLQHCLLKPNHLINHIKCNWSIHSSKKAVRSIVLNEQGFNMVQSEDGGAGFLRACCLYWIGNLNSGGTFRHWSCLFAQECLGLHFPCACLVPWSFAAGGCSPGRLAAQDVARAGLTERCCC